MYRHVPVQRVRDGGRDTGLNSEHDDLVQTVLVIYLNNKHVLDKDPEPRCFHMRTYLKLKRKATKL